MSAALLNKVLGPSNFEETFLQIGALASVGFNRGDALISLRVRVQVLKDRWHAATIFGLIAVPIFELLHDVAKVDRVNASLGHGI